MENKEFELLRMKVVLDDLKIQCESPMMLSCDDKSNTSIAHKKFQRDMTKHIKID